MEPRGIGIEEVAKGLLLVQVGRLPAWKVVLTSSARKRTEHGL
ncbi:MAG: hypothetical protein ACT4TC_13730 [Myxococcaceae bacterium]